MRGKSFWTHFKRGMSGDFQRGIQKLSPAGAEALQRSLASLHTIPWWTLLVVVGVPLLLLAIWKLPQWYAASWDMLTDPKDVARLESDTRTALVQAAGGLALLAGLLFTWRNLRMTEQNSRHTLDLSRKGQINDRFTKAIEQLGAVDQEGSKKLEVRLGGIYALEQIAKDSPDDHHWPIMEILTAYVREHASQSDQPPPTPATDIQAILTVLGRRTRFFGEGEDQGLNLAGTVLLGAHLEGAHLEEAHLREAHLEGVRLDGADLKEADLRGARLERADLREAHLEGADLRGAYLERARGLAVEQLASIQTLYRAHLDPSLLARIRAQYPHLLEEPQD